MWYIQEAVQQEMTLAEEKDLQTIVTHISSLRLCPLTRVFVPGRHYTEVN